MGKDWLQHTFGKEYLSSLNLYKRVKPREKSLEQVHDLWLRASQRCQKQQAYLSSVIDEIVSTTEKNSKNEWIVYFKIKDIFFSYNISYNHEFKSHGYSYNRVEFNKDLAVGRNEKLEFILANEQAFKLGEKLRLAEKNRSNKSYMVESKMHEMIEDKLRAHFKETGTLPKDITIIEIGNKKYYAKVDSQHRYTYLKFKLVGDVDETDAIKIT